MRLAAPASRVGGSFLLAVTVLALPLAAGPARAGEAYYLLMFGSQRVPNDPDYSHSFATFVRATWPGDGDCPGPSGVALEAHTISWLPCNGRVRTLALRPECGRNYGLDETLRLALGTGQRVALWGPFRIEPDLYARALRRIAGLEGGGVCYKANDAGHRSDRVSNCIHAISTVADGPRLRVASPGWGEVASYAVLLRLEPWVTDRGHTEDWVAAALGLDAYPIVYRRWRPPASGTLLGPAYRLLGGERGLEATYGPPALRAGS